MFSSTDLKTRAYNNRAPFATGGNGAGAGFRALRAIGLLTAATLLTGCLLTVDSETSPVHMAWSDGDLARLQVGGSSQDWVRSSFGEPVSKLSYADGSEIWKYRNRTERDTEVGLFLIFSVDVESEKVDTLSIEFVDGVVSNYWTEERRH